MKRLFVLLLTLTTITHAVQAGEFSSTVFTRAGNGWEYEKIIAAPDVAKKDLYDRAKVWVVSNVKSVDVNTLYDDKNQEMIITTASLAIPNLKYSHLTDQALTFKLHLAFKDGKVKVTASGLTYFGISSSRKVYDMPVETLELKGFVPSPYKQIQEHFDAAFLGFVKNLEKALTSAAKNDW